MSNNRLRHLDRRFQVQSAFTGTDPNAIPFLEPKGHELHWSSASIGSDSTARSGRKQATLPLDGIAKKRHLLFGEVDHADGRSLTGSTRHGFGAGFRGCARGAGSAASLAAPYLLAFELCCCFCVCAPSAIKRSQVGCSCCGSRMLSRNKSRPSPGKGMCANL